MFSRQSSVLRQIPRSLGGDRVSLPFLLNEIDKRPHVMAVEIEKAPTCLFKKSVWAGNKAGGMSSWMSALLPHLPFTNFYLYMERGSLECEEEPEYLNEYFQKLFYKNYLGYCVGNRSEINPSFLYQVDWFPASKLPLRLSSSSNVALIDVRTSEQIKKEPVENLPTSQSNFQYLNIPINDDDLGEKFYSATEELEGQWELITMCAKGYRSMISYSTFRHFLKDSWKISTCRSSISEINKSLREFKKLPKN